MTNDNDDPVVLDDLNVEDHSFGYINVCDDTCTYDFTAPLETEFWFENEVLEPNATEDDNSASFEMSISDYMTCSGGCTSCTVYPTLEVFGIYKNNYDEVSSTVIEVTIIDDKAQFNVYDIDLALTACID